MLHTTLSTNFCGILQVEGRRTGNSEVLRGEEGSRRSLHFKLNSIASNSRTQSNIQSSPVLNIINGKVGRVTPVRSNANTTVPYRELHAGIYRRLVRSILTSSPQASNLAHSGLHYLTSTPRSVYYHFIQMSQRCI